MRHILNIMSGQCGNRCIIDPGHHDRSIRRGRENLYRKKCIHSRRRASDQNQHIWAMCKILQEGAEVLVRRCQIKHGICPLDALPCRYSKGIPWIIAALEDPRRQLEGPAGRDRVRDFGRPHHQCREGQLSPFLQQSFDQSCLPCFPFISVAMVLLL